MIEFTDSPSKEPMQGSDWMSATFPVTWTYPSDAALTWTLDLEHMSYPTTPLYFTVNAYTVAVGFRKAAATYFQPVIDKERRRINTYFYRAPIEFTGSRRERISRSEMNKAVVEKAMAALTEQWFEDWLPEIEGHLAFWEHFDLPGASTELLLRHLDETLQRSARLWELHFLIEPPMQLALREFSQFHSELFGNRGTDAYNLLVGFPNATVSMSHALWQFSRRVLSWPEVCSTLLSGPPNDALSKLPQLTQGLLFLRELSQFLNEYGQRPTRTDWGYPSWSEDPTIVLGYLTSYVQLTDRELSLDQHTQAQLVKENTDHALAEIEGYPRPVITRFRELLRTAQLANVLTEEHTYYIVARGMHLVRSVMLEFGRRFTLSATIENPTDVFYLTLDELRSSAIVRADIPRRDLVSARRAEMHYWGSVRPPTKLGKASPPVAAEQEEAGDQGRREQTSTPDNARDGVELHGQAASGGRARGTARVISSLQDARRVKMGDVVIIDNFAPSWAPLFLLAAAVVTNTGGELSHAAIIAREFQIPAVVGTGNATELISDDEDVEVDGSQGIVRVMPVEGSRA